MRHLPALIILLLAALLQTGCSGQDRHSTSGPGDAVAADAAEDERLGLHADGGQWRFDAGEDAEPRKARVLLIGDSILMGYKDRVAKALGEDVDVDAWSTGMHLASEKLHSELTEVVKKGPYDVIHFNIGLHGWQPGRIPEGQYEPLLRAYIAILREYNPDAKIIWASTTPITVKGKPTELNPENNPTIVERNAIALRVAADSGIMVNDLYGLMIEHMETGRGDSFHWNPPGQKLQGEQITRYVQEALTKDEAKK